MAKVTEIDPIKDQQWDEFVLAHPLGWLCHHSGWKRVLDRSFGHMKGHYLAIIQNGEIKAALPVYEVRSWLLGHRLISVPFATLCDPLVTSPAEMNTLVEETFNLMRSVRASSIEIKTLSSSTLVNNDNLSSNLYHKYHYMRLGDPPELLMKNFDRSCVRQKIAKAMKSNLTLEECRSEEDLRAFHKLHALTRKERQGLPPKPYILFESLWQVFSPTNNVSILLCRWRDRIIAGVMLFKFRDRISIEIAAYDTKLVHLCPMHFLIWHSIQMAYREGYKILDFGSTPFLDKGLMDFKKRWATTVCDLVNFNHPRRESQHHERVESAGYKIVQSILRRAPDAVVSTIGRFVYHHLG